MTESTYVAYHIPSDGDSEDVPNVFVIRKALASITLGDIKQVRCCFDGCSSAVSAVTSGVLFHRPSARRTSPCPGPTTFAPSKHIGKRLVRGLPVVVLLCCCCVPRVGRATVLSSVLCPLWRTFLAQCGWTWWMTRDLCQLLGLALY